MLIGSCSGGIGGGILTMFMTTVAYVNDVSHDDSRTSRLSLLYACASLASMVSYSVSGIILDSTNYQTVFTLCLIIYGIGVLYVICLVREIKPKTQQQMSDNYKHLSGDDKPIDATAGIVNSSCRIWSLASSTVARMIL